MKWTLLVSMIAALALAGAAFADSPGRPIAQNAVYAGEQVSVAEVNRMGGVQFGFSYRAYPYPYTDRYYRQRYYYPRTPIPYYGRGYPYPHGYGYYSQIPRGGYDAPYGHPYGYGRYQRPGSIRVR